MLLRLEEIKYGSTDCKVIGDWYCIFVGPLDGGGSEYERRHQKMDWQALGCDRKTFPSR